MINYITADLNRILRKKSFFSVILGYMLLFLMMIFIVYTKNFDMNEYISKSNIFMEFYSIIVGIPVFLSVYYDDFKSKSMQTAIGYGLPRYKFILVKAIESFIIAALIGVIFGAIMVAVPFLLKLSVTNTQVIEVILNMSVNTLKIIGYLSISTILVYYSQNAVSGVIGYILLASSVVFMLLNMALGQEFIVNIFGDLTRYLYYPMLFSAKENFMQNGTFGLVNSIGIILYIVVPAIVSIILFKRKELEF